MNIKRVLHIGVMVREMKPVKALYHNVLGLSVNNEELYNGTVDICFLPVGDTSIELFADNPKTGEGLVAELISKQGGEGIQHIAFEVDDINEAINELKAKNVPIREGDPSPGAHGTTVAFLETSATYGVTIELVENAKETIQTFS